MSEIKTHARAVADVIDGLIVASVEIARTPERVFQALSSREVVDWWVNPGVFDTREWSGDVRVGGPLRRSRRMRFLRPVGSVVRRDRVVSRAVPRPTLRSRA